MESLLDYQIKRLSQYFFNKKRPLSIISELWALIERMLLPVHIKAAFKNEVEKAFKQSIADFRI